MLSFHFWLENCHIAKKNQIEEIIPSGRDISKVSEKSIYSFTTYKNRINHWRFICANQLIAVNCH